MELPNTGISAVSVPLAALTFGPAKIRVDEGMEGICEKAGVAEKARTTQQSNARRGYVLAHTPTLFHRWAIGIYWLRYSC